MSKERSDRHALVVSSAAKGSEFFLGCLSPEFSVEFSSCGAEARRKLSFTDYDAAVINCPLTDEYGTDLAEEIVNNSSAGVILLVKSDAWESVSFGMEKIGVYCLKKPLSAESFREGARLAAATSERLKAYARKTETLKTKMEEIKLVGRAKLLLMQKLSLSEAEAHKYIERRAMDGCVKRSVVAENVIKTYGD